MPEKSSFTTPPCIGRCSTTYGDTVCRGCKRFCHEIIHWNRCSEIQHTDIWRRLEQNRIHVLQKLFVITDKSLLIATMAKFNIDTAKPLNPYWYLFDLLEKIVKRVPQQDNTTEWGFTTTVSYSDRSLKELYQHCERALLELSSAQFEQRHGRLEHATQTA